MTDNGEPVDPSLFATAVEVDGLRRTFDQFMKKARRVQSKSASNLDYIVQFLDTNNK